MLTSSGSIVMQDGVALPLGAGRLTPYFSIFPIVLCLAESCHHRHYTIGAATSAR